MWGDAVACVSPCEVQDVGVDVRRDVGLLTVPHCLPHGGQQGVLALFAYLEGGRGDGGREGGRGGRERERERSERKLRRNRVN